MQDREWLGREIGQYRLVELIGRGGMGVVYRARDNVLDRDVAIKMLVPTSDDIITQENNQRFLLEAKATAGIKSRHVAQVLQLGTTDEGQAYIVMELLEGRTLLTLLLRERRMDPRRAVRIVRQVAKGLQAAHALGVVHRDLKPSNIMLVTMDGEQEVAKILDFGVAKRITGVDDGITQQGALLGTLQFMAPEQVQGGQVDARTDVYSLGVLLYRMLSGHVPFEANNLAEMVDIQLTSAPESLLDKVPGMPPALDDAVLICLAKDPGQRWQSMADLEEALWKIFDNNSPRSPVMGTTLPMGTTASSLMAEQAALQAALLAGQTPQTPFSVPKTPVTPRESTPPHVPSAEGARASGSAPRPGRIVTPRGSSGLPAHSPARGSPASGLPMPAGESGIAPVMETETARLSRLEVSDVRSFEESLRKRHAAMPVIIGAIVVGAVGLGLFGVIESAPEVPLPPKAEAASAVVEQQPTEASADPDFPGETLGRRVRNEDGATKRGALVGHPVSEAFPHRTLADSATPPPATPSPPNPLAHEPPSEPSKAEAPVEAPVAERVEYIEASRPAPSKRPRPAPPRAEPSPPEPPAAEPPAAEELASSPGTSPSRQGEAPDGEVGPDDMTDGFLRVHTKGD